MARLACLLVAALVCACALAVDDTLSSSTSSHTGTIAPQCYFAAVHGDWWNVLSLLTNGDVTVVANVSAGNMTMGAVFTTGSRLVVFIEESMDHTVGDNIDIAIFDIMSQERLADVFYSGFGGTLTEVENNVMPSPSRESFALSTLARREVDYLYTMQINSFTVYDNNTIGQYTYATGYQGFSYYEDAQVFIMLGSAAGTSLFIYAAQTTPGSDGAWNTYMVETGTFGRTLSNVSVAWPGVDQQEFKGAYAAVLGDTNDGAVSILTFSLSDTAGWTITMWSVDNFYEPLQTVTQSGQWTLGYATSGVSRALVMDGANWVVLFTERTTDGVSAHLITFAADSPTPNPPLREYGPYTLPGEVQDYTDFMCTF